jgi:hypothetical protein
VDLLQDKKFTLLRLKEMIVGKKSEKGKEVRRKMVKRRMIRRVGDKNRKKESGSITGRRSVLCCSHSAYLYV